MGLSNFLDNFIGGFTFGVLANNPFTLGMFSNPFMCGGYYSSRVDYGTFINPFPSIWGGGFYSSMPIQMPSTFANPSFPTLDFSCVNQSIWDFTSAQFDMQMKAYKEQADRIKQEQTENSSQSNYNNPFYYPQYVTMPYQTYYPPYSAYYEQSQKPSESKSEIKSDTTVKTEEKSDKTSPKAENSSKTTQRKTFSEGEREFAEEYASLGITDTRFQKFFEESILNSEGRSYGKDNKEMAKAGVQQSTYNTYRKGKNLPTQNVEQMTDQEMCEIYYGIYKECGADKIKDDRMALYVFDVGVNSGSKQAIAFYKRSGDNPQTYEKLRRKFYNNLAKKDPNTYGSSLNGWMKRLEKVRKYADKNLSSTA